MIMITMKIILIRVEIVLIIINRQTVTIYLPLDQGIGDVNFVKKLIFLQEKNAENVDVIKILFLNKKSVSHQIMNPK